MKKEKSENLRPTEADFMERWYQMTSYRRMIDRMLEPAIAAIQAYHWPFGDNSVLLEGFEVHESTKGNFIMFTLQCLVNGNMSHQSFTLPIHACLEGESAVKAYFEEEARKQEERANQMGRIRDEREREARRAQYEELRLEFERNEEAIVLVKEKPDVKSER